TAGPPPRWGTCTMSTPVTLLNSSQYICGALPIPAEATVTLPGLLLAFIVENRSGAGGTLAAEAVAKSPPDGYTLHLTTSADAWNASLYDKLNFNIIRDFSPVATIARGPGVLVVHPSFR